MKLDSEGSTHGRRVAGAVASPSPTSSDPPCRRARRSHRIRKRGRALSCERGELAIFALARFGVFVVVEQRPPPQTSLRQARRQQGRVRAAEEGIEPSQDRLTADCPSIGRLCESRVRRPRRRRCEASERRGRAERLFARSADPKRAARREWTRGSPMKRRVVTERNPTKTAGRIELREQDSNLCCRGQNQSSESFRWTIPKCRDVRRRGRGPGGGSNPRLPDKSRRRFLLRHEPRRRVPSMRGSGTRGGRTLISRVKSPVPCRLSERPPSGTECASAISRGRARRADTCHVPRSHRCRRNQDVRLRSSGASSSSARLPRARGGERQEPWVPRPRPLRGEGADRRTHPSRLAARTRGRKNDV